MAQSVRLANQYAIALGLPEGLHFSISIILKVDEFFLGQLWVIHLQVTEDFLISRSISARDP